MTAPTKLLCIDSRTRLVNRYEGKKRTNVARLPAVENTNWKTIAELELYRDLGPLTQRTEAQTS